MKKHLSVFMLMVRSSFYPIVGLLMAMAVIQSAVFCRLLFLGSSEEVFGLEHMVSGSHLGWIFGIFFWLIAFFLLRTGNGHGSKQGYTLLRLGISERWVFFWQCVYNCLMFTLFWLVECLIVLGLTRLYVHCAPQGYVTGQTVFLAFHRSDFLHSLLPMDDTLAWVRNGILVLCLGICAARFPVDARRGYKFQEFVPLACITVPFFTQGLGNGGAHILTITVALLLVTFSLYKTFVPSQEGEDDA